MTYQSPGVYIEEVPSGPQPIAGASTSVLAVLGVTRKGPVLAPTRVTGWEDFVRTFGAPTARGHTGESVFGFFENGGPAAWVVRVDPSTSAAWTAFDGAGRASFRLAATSPGSWANAVSIGVRADAAGASGMFFRTVTTGPSVDVTAAGTHTLPVASTVGLRPGDPIAIVAAPAEGTVAAPVRGTVVSSTETAITLSAKASVRVPAGSVIAGAVEASAGSAFLASGKGFKPGDVVVATAANGGRADAVVTDVRPAGAGVTLTLDQPWGAVDGAAFVRRRTRYGALAKIGGAVSGEPPTASVPLSALTFENPATAPAPEDLAARGAASAAARLTTVDGRTADWEARDKRFAVVGSTAPANGQVWVDAPAVVVVLADAGLSLAGLTPAVVEAGYGFLPAGTRVTFTGEGAPAVVATRTAGSFALAPEPNPAHTYTAAAFTLQTDADAGLAVRAAVEPRVGDRLDLGGTFAPIVGVESHGGQVYVLRFTPGTAVPDRDQDRFGLYAIESATVSAERFALDVAVAGAPAESFAGLSLSPDHPQYFARDGVINGASAYVTVAPRDAGAPAVSGPARPGYTEATTIGSDQPASPDDFRQGLTRLEEVPEPALVIAPDSLAFGDPLLQADVVGKVVAHCEEFRRFALVDAPDLGDQDLLAWRNTYLSSAAAALYAPHLRIVTIDPDAGDRFATVPASGFVAGVFARTDRLRGVHKAPGNEALTGVVGLSQTYTQRRQDLLNPAGINLIRAFPGRGTRLWGARTATDDTAWRYVNVRRLFTMIETSVERATQWVVFEPNTAQTWIRIKVSIENFLDQQWRAGALAGAKPEHAFRVRVGLGETMTEADVDNGLVITEVAIAPAKPAEFVVFRFSHKRLSE